jgi:hypothetical protein
MKNFETPWQNGCSYEKGSLGRDMPSIGTLVGLMLASTWLAASALVELSSSSSSSWRGLCQWPDWAPHRLGTRALAPWACSWSLQGHKPNSAVSSTSGSSKRFFCYQWLACSDTLACPWWSLEGLLAAAQNWPISYKKGLWESSSACWRSCIQSWWYSCRAPVEDGLWIHNAIGCWAYQAKIEEEEERIDLVLFVNEN